ncbi:single-stranded DNA-binding protein [Staphylococcus sp. HMSC059E03]|uniref:single-stranded DNA-binding protein n=1 Tax=Staphylococcus TaxID=1279 RepID=UPI000763C816|nr:MULTISPECIES: single-stranded DNA-binding protein [Staphylococcus]KXA44553.1 single-strand binding family protein [Staphylococcus simulans]OFM14800.1 single-stranded DNA-binding protein [Staphylococcus sp. HMSC059E03]OFN19816.1 single-stranded DNA-binding protein [Staphylococcus sp. HMSC055C03]OFV07312.1 single-stranded DNA-binding protein [Staphylococcus sp. HMSC12H08]
MLNRVVLVGRLTADPQYRVTPSSLDVATFTLAVNRNFKDKNGEQQVDFINCVVFRKQAENVNNYLNKGSLAGVDGRLQSRSYENDEGRRVFVKEVVCDSVQFLEPKNAQTSNNNQSNNEVQQREKALQSENPFNNSNNFDMDDSSLPF